MPETEDETMATTSSNPTEDIVATKSKFVAIGSSAQGIPVIARLVSLLPPSTGLTFGIALDHEGSEGNLVARLRAHTTMPIVVATSPTPLKPDHIYVAPAGLDLSIAERHAVAATPVDDRGARCSVDRLFRCVAAEFGDAAVGIVLAGSGADGAIGLKLLKERGGITMAQVPGESIPDEMARVAVATGFVDFVLPLEGIAWQLASATSPAPLQTDGASADDVLRDILVLLRVRTGHDFTHYKRATLVRRVARRMQVTHCETLDDYLRLARQEPSEVAALLRDFMISVTNFFRDADTFEALKNFVVPQLFQSDASEPIRVWIAGCASGEEAYSFGIILLEKREELDPARQIQIFASDIDEAALDEARAGRYLSTIAADVSPKRLDRFFTKDGDYYQVSKELRELVLFASHNVLRDAPFSRVDVMSCRNLLIYLDRTMQDNVLRTAHFALRPDRFLVLGSSENAETNEGLFHAFDPKHRVYVRQPKSALVLPSMGSKPRWTTPVFMSVRPEERTEAIAPTSGELHYRMVERYAPPSLLVNERLEVSHISQRAGRYLQSSPGEPTRDLFQLVLPELRLDLRAAAYSARRTPGVAASCTARVMINGEQRSVRVGVQSEAATDPAHANLLVWFEEGDVHADAGSTQPASGERPQIEPLVQQLEDELRRTREQLHTTVEQYETLVEELHASNEELQAINEELRSASEEIEASREETDSVNQELSAVNQELKLRMQEATAAKSDIANLMESSDVGVIFMDRDLRIYRFTQRTREIFNILDSDIGRPISDLTPKIDYPHLARDARAVLQTMVPVNREVRAHGQQSYLVRIRPYRSLDDRIAGVVMTFIDITALRRVEDALRNKEAMLELAERAANAGIWELDARGRLRMSDQCHRLYGTQPSPTPLEPAVWLANVREDERERVLEALAAATQRAAVGGLDIEFGVHDPAHGERWLWMLGRRTEPSNDIAGITLDVTTARQARRALEEGDRRKNEFIATLAHELRNPLTPLAMGLDILKMADGDAAQREVARGMMERQMSLLRRLVDDLLEISRIQAGRLELRVEPRIRLADIIDNACEATRVLLDELGHRLVVDVPREIYVDGDRVRLGQVFGNLLTNAAKYTDQRGTITVSTSVEAGKVSISVRDTGVGIEPKLLTQIFELFVQAEPILTRSRGGLGIGLSLVRQLVHLHGGTITAASEGLGKGSCFTVTLPLSTGGQQ